MSNQPTSAHPIQGFYQHQQEVLRTHQQYLEHQLEFARAFWQALQQFGRDAQGQPVEIPQSVQNNLQWFHQHQQETLRVHEQYLRQVGEQTSYALQAGQPPDGVALLAPPMPAALPAPVAQVPATPPPAAPFAPMSAPQPVPTPPQNIPAPAAAPTAPMIPPAAPQTASTPASSSTSPQDAVEALWQIIAEKTGYPTEMLELSMDLEADLGIDSIKRVEILGALQEALPQLETKAEDLAELRTLAQIAEAIGGTPAPSASAQEQATPPQAAASEASTDLGAVLLDIVAEKTGYPTEMLEFSMDLEADLGIDSIKRVEILGALQEREPNLPVQAEELAERRTLGDIVAAFAHDPEKKNS